MYELRDEFGTVLYRADSWAAAREYADWVESQGGPRLQLWCVRRAFDWLTWPYPNFSPN